MIHKKILSLSLAASILITIFSGCGSSSEKSFVSENIGSAVTDLPTYQGETAKVAGEMTEPIGEYSNKESYLTIQENKAVNTLEEDTITLSMKVDTASYSNVQRYIESGSIPPADAVKVEEMINYFQYDTDIAIPEGQPFGVYTEVGPSPFDSEKNLLFVRIKSEEIDKEELPNSNFVFLIDTSGSMYSYDKLPLLQQAFSLLVENLDKDDVVSIVTYAGSSEVLLKGESGANKDKILEAINSLESGGSTAGVDGINTAYEMAKQNFIPGGNNRVMLATDGDFNVGPSSNEELSKLITQKASDEIYLSVLGFGTDNIRDDLMETLSKDGNGNYNYIYNLDTAKKVLVEEMASNTFVVADDVKAQIEFNPENVSNYRLLGYENRLLANEDFTNDTKDAGEIGIGTDVVMLFEIQIGETPSSSVEKKYTSKDEVSLSTAPSQFANELCELRIRYKNPGESESKEISQPILKTDIKTINSSDFQFASSVASFGYLLRDSEYSKNLTSEKILAAAKDSLGKDQKGYRQQFTELVQTYEKLKKATSIE